MSLLSWLKHVTGRRLDLDDEDFEDEIRAHLAIAERERVADGADPESARLAALKEFGNVTLTTEAARRIWRPRWLDWLRDLLTDARYAVRSLRKNPVFALAVVGVLTAGDRPERRGVHDAQEHRAHPARRRRRGRQARGAVPRNRVRSPAGRVLPGLPESPRRTIARSPASWGPRWPPSASAGARAAGRSGRTGHRQLLPGARRERVARPHAAPVRRKRAGPPARGRPERRAVAPRLRRRPRHRRQDHRDQRHAADGRRRRRSGLPRHDGGLRRRGVHSGHDGASARLQVRQPADDGGRRAGRPAGRPLLPAGLPPARARRWRTPPRRQRRSLPHRRARVRSRTPANGFGSCRSGSRPAARRSTCCRR